MLDHALQYAARGWAIFRLTGFKTPLKGSHGFKDATTDPAVVEAWWGGKRPPNIGLATGWHESGPNLLVLDLDGPVAIAELADLARTHGGLPPTLTAATSKGFHIYLELPAAVRLRSRNAKRAARGGDGIDIRADGGYVVIPPSINRKTGKAYTWVDAGAIVAAAPAWLIAWCQERANPPRPVVGIPTTRESVAFGPLPQHLQGLGGRDLTQAVLSAERRAELPDLLAALARIPASLQYYEWFKVGAAIYDFDPSEQGLAIFKAWSWSDEGHRQELDVASCEKKWLEYQKDKGNKALITKASIYAWASEKVSEQATVKPEAFVSSNVNATVESVFESPSEVGNNVAGNNPFEQQNNNGGQHFGSNGHSFAGANGAPFEDAGGFGTGTAANPLIELNNKYAVIGDVGSKCLVLSWVPSKVDEELRVPSFQTFKSFSERYANKYVTVAHTNDKGEKKEESKQLGAHWLKWPKRRSFEGIDLMPGKGALLPGGILNLWSGFAVQPVAGNWDRMKAHIVEVLACGNAEAATYIFKFAAWCVQHPGERAEVALVFRGGKGSGKGTFANALKRIFGQHGLQIFNSKHLVGSFNGHLRNCLLLFSDEAFWAGDKSGESTLKGMLTEPALMIEQKGIDALPWRNRLKVIMSANADWVVPASHDERRYCIFEVSDGHIDDETYFEALYNELDAGGLPAMLHDLLRVDLEKWHPRKIIQNEALRHQKERSLTSLQEWYVELLEGGKLPGRLDKTKDRTSAISLLLSTREHSNTSRPLTATALGRFLTLHKNTRLHTSEGNFWHFSELKIARATWELKYKGWTWPNTFEEWL